MNVLERLIGRCRGSYVLLVSVPRRISFECGSLGDVNLEKGIYCYVGSSRGPGGVWGRVRRHMGGRKRSWWHIDRLLDVDGVRVEGVLWFCRSDLGESEIARALMECNFKPAVPGFGSSDSEAESHLFRCGGRVEDAVPALISCLLRGGVEVLGFLRAPPGGLCFPSDTQATLKL